MAIGIIFKNPPLRSVLYYVIAITAVCLMIEISRRVPPDSLYEVRTPADGSGQPQPMQEKRIDNSVKVGLDGKFSTNPNL